jgi:hypothetical protein
VNVAKLGSEAGNYFSGKRRGRGESQREREIGYVRSKLGTAAGNFISGKRDRLVKVRLA